MTKFSTFNFEHNAYAYKYSPNNSYVNIINNVKVNSIEKSIVDCIDNLKTYDDWEELLEILTLIPAIDGSKIIEYLVHINKDILFNKVGLILSHFINNMFLTKHHIDAIKQKSSTLTKYFNNDKYRLNTYYKDWNLYSYNIKNLLN